MFPVIENMVAPAKEKEQEVDRRSEEWKDMGSASSGGEVGKRGVFGEMPKTTAMNAEQRIQPVEGRDPIARHQSACERSIPADGRCVTRAAAAARHCGVSRSRLAHASKPSAIGSKRTGGSPNASHRGSLLVVHARSPRHIHITSIGIIDVIGSTRTQQH
jgi:hypothetical protein